MDFLNILLYYVLVPLFILGVAINIHEFGHFIVAKMFGMRVEAYSFFGLGPRLFGFRWGHTDYRVSAIPLGAYVKLYGDEANAGLEAADVFDETVPREELYELRPRWQKFLVMIGGPFMNVVLALAIPFAGALIYGVPAIPAPIVGAIKSGGAADKAGIRTGDRIVNFNGIENPTWQRISDDALLLPERETPVTVERDGQRINLKITPTKIIESGQPLGLLDFAPDTGAEPVVVGNIQHDMPAASSGLQKGDIILSVNGKGIQNVAEMKKIIGENKDQPIRLTIKRGAETKEIITQAVQRDNDWRIGIAFDSNLAIERVPVGIGGAAREAFNQNLRILRLTAMALGQVFAGARSARDTVSGPVGIIQQSAQAAQIGGWDGILAMLMAISLSLGVFNLLPIPMLDGGQIMVLGIEKVMSWFGMQLSTLIRERIQLAGLGIVLLLMIFVMFNDISRIIGR
jgi:regulator of sigma E protease